MAVFNPGTEPVSVKVTASAGDASGYSTIVANLQTIPSFGWYQFSGILNDTGIAQGWVTIEKVGGNGSFGAYGVINDNGTSDGSFITATGGVISGDHVTVPVLVETATFRSELVLTNRGSATATMTLRYSESLTPALGAGGQAIVQLRPGEQQIIPEAIEYLRRNGPTSGGEPRDQQ